MTETVFCLLALIQRLKTSLFRKPFFVDFDLGLGLKTFSPITTVVRTRFSSCTTVRTGPQGFQARNESFGRYVGVQWQYHYSNGPEGKEVSVDFRVLLSLLTLKRMLSAATQ